MIKDKIIFVMKKIKRHCSLFIVHCSLPLFIVHCSLFIDSAYSAVRNDASRPTAGREKVTAVGRAPIKVAIHAERPAAEEPEDEIEEEVAEPTVYAEPESTPEPEDEYAGIENRSKDFAKRFGGEHDGKRDECSNSDTPIKRTICEMKMQMKKDAAQEKQEEQIKVLMAKMGNIRRKNATLI